MTKKQASKRGGLNVRSRHGKLIVLLDRHGRVASNVPGWPGDDAVARALEALLAQS